MINPQIKATALKVSEMMLLFSRRLTDAANSNDMLVLRRELKEIGTEMQTGGTMLLNSSKSTSFDTSQLQAKPAAPVSSVPPPLRPPPAIQKPPSVSPLKSFWNWLIEK